MDYFILGMMQENITYIKINKGGSFMNENEENKINNPPEEEKNASTEETPIEVKPETQKEQASSSQTAVEGEILEEDKPGLSITSMVLVIISLVLWCYWPISIICGVLALIFGIIRMKKPNGKGMAIAGFVTGLIAVVFWGAIFGLAFLGVAVYNLAI